MYAQDSMRNGLPLYIKTAGKLPQLAWSNGTDRLGSAKMGYIDTGITLPVADTLQQLYKVQLAANKHAFIDKNLTMPVTLTHRPATVTMESWRIKGGDGPDSLTITLGRKVAYQSWMELHPARIVLELYGVQANTNWITQLGNTREIQSADYRQIADDVVQITLYLRHTHHYGYHISYQGNRLLLTVKVPPAEKKLKGRTIVIDAGHGGSNTGARGVQTGILEKDYTLLIAKELEQLLVQKGATVHMVRTKDTAIDNKDRVLWAMALQPDLFISIHLNSAGRPEVKGTSTYYKHIGFMPLSKAILKELLLIPDLAEFGLIGSFNFQPVQPTAYASTLVEVAFLSNPDDENRIRNQAFRAKVARQIKLGVEAWLRAIQQLES